MAANLEAAIEQAVRRGIAVASAEVVGVEAVEPAAAGRRGVPRWLATTGQVAFGGLIATSLLLLFQWGQMSSGSAATVRAVPLLAQASQEPAPVPVQTPVQLPVQVPVQQPVAPAVVPPRAIHPQPASTEPGYDRLADGTQKWIAGRRHPQFAHITTTATEGQWRADAGYRFPDRDSLVVRWTPGVAHPDAAHVLASAETDNWHPEPGYGWLDATAANDFRVQWRPGVAHPTQPHVFTGDREGVWVPAAGFTWANQTPGDLAVVKQGPTDQQFQQAFEQFAAAMVCHAAAEASKGSVLGDLVAEAARQERDRGIRNAVASLLPHESSRAISAVARIVVQALDGQLNAREWMSSDGRAWLVQQLRNADPEMADAYAVAEALARLLSR